MTGAVNAAGRASLAGLAAIAMWATLALLTASSGGIPPFQLCAMTFAIGTLVGIASLAWRRVGLSVFRQRPAVWLVGTLGLFGYHALYFAALRAAPPAEASLVAYLWPLLIVVGSALLPGERLRWFHLVGAALGFAGAALLIGGGGLAISAEYAAGYALAALCALTWTGYSLLSRRFADVPSDLVCGFCLATAVLSLLAHLAFETTVWPNDAGTVLSVVLLGLFPVGAAFYLWDHAMKAGDVRAVGAASYAAPILSTLLLVLTGRAPATGTLALAASLVTAGALLAALPTIRRAVGR